MIQDRYDVDLFFKAIQTLATEMDPELSQIDEILDDDEIFQAIKQDMAQLYPQSTRTGRPSTPVEVILRVLAVKRLYQWSYEQTERHVGDSLVLRQFCRVYFEAVPDDTTLIRWAGQIKPQTLETLNARVTAIAKTLKVTRGRKLRTDGTVVETNIAYPSDSKLLADGVRVISRVIKRLKSMVGEGMVAASQTFRDRTRSARRQAHRIANAARRRSEAAKGDMRTAYRQLIRIAQASIGQARTVLELISDEGLQAAHQMAERLETFVPRVEQILNQTIRRVLQGESVPATEKIVSIFEPHTAIIRRQKAGKPTEFGRKVWLDEVDGGLITDWRILQGNPPDREQWKQAIDHHIRQWAKPPHQASGDRGLYSPDNEAYAQKCGVKHSILPKPGRKSEQRCQHEAQSWFKRGRRFHAGIEGRISVVKRKHGLDRCLDHEEQGFHRWVGWGIIAANLGVMGATLAARSA